MQNPVTLCLWELLEYLNQFQFIPHNFFITYNSAYVVVENHLPSSTETHGNVIFSPTVKKEKGREPKCEHIRLSDVISQD